MERKKGFTLVELIAVITILSIVLVLTVPTLLNNLSDKKEKTKDKVIELIKTAALNYFIDYGIDGPAFVRIEELCEKYIDCPIIDPSTEEEITGFVTIDENKNYSIVSGVTLTLDLNGGSTTQVFENAYPSGTIIELKEPTKEGYRFMGWTVSGGTLNGNEFIIGTSNVTITANFEQLLVQAIYSETDNSLFFIADTKQYVAGDKYNDKVVTAVYTGFETQSYYARNAPWYLYKEAIKKVLFIDEISPIATANWFNGFKNCESINLNNLNTSNVTDMFNMFANAGYNSTDFTLNLGDKFDTRNVTDMRGMFDSTGYNSTNFTLDLGDKFDTSQATNISRMFYNTGYSSTNFTLDLGDKFDTSQVTNMSYMFYSTGYSSTNFTLDLGDKFDTRNVTDMSYMFYYTGYNSTKFTLDLGDEFDTSQVTNMSSMFYSTGRSSTNFTLDLGDKFDTSQVTNMSIMFSMTGYSDTEFTLDLGDKFDTSQVTNMSSMFYGTGYSSTDLTLDLGSKFTFKTGVNTSGFIQYSGVKKLIIPETVTNIPSGTFKYMNKLTEIVFEHPSTSTITLPTAGSSTGAFYVVSRTNTTVTTTNETIKNYDWASDNRTVTFK